MISYFGTNLILEYLYETIEKKIINKCDRIARMIDTNHIGRMVLFLYPNPKCLN